MKYARIIFQVIGFLAAAFSGYGFLNASAHMAGTFLAGIAPLWFALSAIAILGALIILFGWFGKFNKWAKWIVAVLMIIGVIGCVGIPIIVMAVPHVVVAYVLGFVGVLLTTKKSEGTSSQIMEPESE